MVGIKQFGKVGLIYGGDSPEREVSLRSGAATLNALEILKIPFAVFDADGYDLACQIKENKIDRCLIMQHGGHGENGDLQGMLESMKIPYTGSGVLGCSLAMNKVASKAIWKYYDMPLAKSRLMKSEIDFHGFDFSVAIKPTSQGSSVGTHKVKAENEVKNAYSDAKQYGDVMIEQWIEGREYTVSIVNGKALPAIWIEPTTTEFYDYHAKYNAQAKTRYHCPSGLDQTLENKLQKMALKAFDAIHCTGWGRVDFMIDKENNPYLMEVNTVPGMTELSLVPQAAKAYGWDFKELIVEILKTSFKK